MSEGLDDLLPLFLAEASDRLERLVVLAPRVEQDAELARKARRELHALKGASNMMRLKEMSEICHHAEDLLDPPVTGSAAALLEQLDRLSGLIATLKSAEGSGGGAATAPAGTAAAPPAAATGAAPPGLDLGGDEVRLRTELLDELADRSARLRLLAVSTGGTVERVFQLARLAERGVAEREPRQVLATLTASMRQLAIELEAGQRSMQHLADRQLEALLHLQVQPLRPYLLNLARHARELARSLGKEVEVGVEAGDSHLDRRIVDALKEAFLHLVRNAVDHGLERPELRVAAGKPATGSVCLEAMTEGGRVRIRVADDGAGIDLGSVVAAAEQRGLITPAQAARLSPTEILQLLVLPGLSTREQASDLSGRGVGLDAVASAVRGVGGDLEVASTAGHGTTITLDVPVARRGERVLLCSVGQFQVALPVTVVRAFRRAEPEAVVRQAGHSLVRLDDRLLLVQVLADVLGESSAESGILVECVVGGAPVAIVVDRVLGEEEVLVRPLPSFGGAPPVFEGVALLASGCPVPVLSPHRLKTPDLRARSTPTPAVRTGPLRLLLVDDSRVTREMLRRLLEDSGFAVTAVGSAGEALDILTAGEFDCMLTDIEMPGMNGLALTRHLRETPRFAHLPVVVVSTRDRPQDRLAGLEAGADAYLAKQQLNGRELVSLIQRVGGRA